MGYYDQRSSVFMLNEIGDIHRLLGDDIANTYKRGKFRCETENLEDSIVLRRLLTDYICLTDPDPYIDALQDLKKSCVKYSIPIELATGTGECDDHAIITEDGNCIITEAGADIIHE